jgi:predicted DNA-binding protein
MKAKTKPVPIRIDALTIARLDKAAKHLASSRAALIRMAILQILAEIESGQMKRK